VIDNPLHPYTQGLLAAIPENHSDMRTMKSIPGSVPHARDFVQGCRFADRCSVCAESSAELQAKCRSCEVPPQKFAHLAPATKQEANLATGTKPEAQASGTHFACCFKDIS